MSHKLNFECTATMARLSNNIRSSGLKDLAQTLLGAKVTLYEDVVSKSEDEFDRYALNDAIYTFKLFPILKSELEQKGLLKLYELVERPFILLNLECQKNGFTIDRNLVSDEIYKSKSKTTALMKDLNEPDTNWNSPKQVKKKIYGDYNLPLQFNKNILTTSKKALKALKDKHEKVKLLVEIKELQSYLKQLESLLKFVDPKTSKIYPFINPIGADTGRATSSCPNLQNIKKESNLRKCFVASPKHKLIVADFGQIEPRVLGHFVYPSKFSELFNSDQDFYVTLANKLFSNLSGEIPARSVAKQVTLAIFYGMGNKRLSENLNVSESEGQNFRNSFFAEYPEIKVFDEIQTRFARENGYIIGLLNRRRYIKNLQSNDKFQRFKAERQILNSIIQGSAATLFKYKLNILRKELPKEVRFLLHVHDEVILDCPENISEEILIKSKKILEAPVSWFSIPLKVEIGIGNSWAEAKNNPWKGGE